MTRNLSVVASTLLALGFVAYACTNGEVVEGPVGTGSAGSTGPGLAGTTGSGTAGTTSTSRGGTTGQAGNSGPGLAGTFGRGGTTGQAGNSGPGIAGTFGRGGTTGAGGTFAAAGTTGSGQAGTSGSTLCPATWTVTDDGFVRAPLPGGASCWHGYAFAGGDTGTTLTPTTFATCGPSCTLRTAGTVGPATMANNYVGVGYIGFNIAQDMSSSATPTVAPTGTGIRVAFTAATGGQPLRLQVSQTDSVFWCFTITGASPVMVPYNMLNTKCWDGTGTNYNKEPIKNVELVVPGGMTATSGVSLTITSITEY